MKKSNNEAVEQVMNNQSSLIFVDSDSYQSVIANILHRLVNEEGNRGLYVALNKPYKELLKFFKSKDLNTDNLFFFDTLTRGGKHLDNVTYVFPEDLENLSKEIIGKCSNCDFVLFDTIDTFLLYNQKQGVEKFFKKIIKTIKTKKKKCVMFGMKEALIEHMLHSSLENLSDGILDYAPSFSSSKKFEKTFLKL